MICPKCKHPKSMIVFTKDATQRASKTTYRRRKCKACGQTWGTVEAPLSKYSDLTIKKEEAEIQAARIAQLALDNVEIILNDPLTPIKQRTELTMFLIEQREELLKSQQQAEEATAQQVAEFLTRV